ncbi:MAG: competence/damage-inducible protein A [Acidobacteriia bacterium]|nr:competence/damage-inducible protein A [Terriglobia bacterium]
MIAEIVAIGSELLTPYRQDTNSLYLTEKLNALGIQVAFKTVVGDSREHLTAVARIAMQRADVVIFMGGLGPTEDDLTREAVADALGIELKRDPEIVTELYKRFAARRIKMPDNNLQQADVLPGAFVLPNPRGSAPGQWLERSVEGRNRILLLLPGPPWELKPMFDEQCFERLKANLPPAFLGKRELKIAMMGESECDRRASAIYKKYDDVRTTILADVGECQLHLVCRADAMETAQARVDELAGELEDEFDEFVFATHGETLEQIVGYYLDMRGATIAVAESCTGGMLATRLTSVSGSSRYFLGGAIVYSNDLKKIFADVPPLLIKEKGAVSKEVAIALAEGIRKKCKATFGVGVTGIAGPGGASESKPVGLVYVALADGSRTDVVERHFPGDRERIRRWATQQALDLVRRKLM